MTSHLTGARTPRAALLLALALTLGLLGWPAPAAVASASAGTAPTGPASTERTDGAARVSLTSMSAGPLSFDSPELRVTVVVHAGDAPLDDAVARLGIDRDSATHTRDWVAAWDDDDPDGPTGREVAVQDVPDVAAGESATVTFEVNRAQMGLGAWTAWGTQGLAVVVSDDDGPVAALRTFVTWDPGTGSQVEPVGVSLVAAVTGPPVDTDPLTAASDLQSAVSDDGRLADVLAATTTLPDVAWAVDPEVVDAASALGESGSSWAEALLGATEGRDVFALPAFDPDVAAYAHAGALVPRLPVSGALADVRQDLAWPVGPPDLATVSTAVASGSPLVVATGDALAPTGATTPTGITEVETSDGSTARMVVADTTLTDLLAGPPGDESEEALLERRLVAETAAVAAQAPSRGRTLVVAFSRTWDPDPATLAARVEALEQSGWSSTVPISQLLDTRPSTDARTPLAEREVDTDELAPAVVTELAASRDQLASISSIVPDPEALTTVVDPQLVAPSAVAFRSSLGERLLAVDAARTAIESLADGVQVVPGSTFNLIADSGDVTVRLRNNLPQEASVRLVLTPDDPRLQIEENPSVVVPANSDLAVPVTVDAVGSGNVVVDVQVLGQDGTEVTAPSSFEVRVRAEWEGVGTAVGAVLLGLLLVGGIWRTVRRGRSARRAAADEVEIPDPTAGQPTAEQSTAGQTTGQQSTAGQTTGQQSTAGQTTGQQSTAGATRPTSMPDDHGSTR
ncbi:hypothetical protein CLV28_1216 [Sediminihabitans luteus]|uniref:Uncharacterized protein n=1 Tax=Sediminihabitans luteus TaxID=1138585 RepID=A0A2M9D1A4_9CELL|nr:DUF6049 family protein [Sediminihabitans luteus]PJJ77986.1 hypothetical protein CLV28_1216 [Sediminihabitans luteus]GIJ00640.1 hypothetical protein Slu03_30170 [Sediminihabitans luteus]